MKPAGERVEREQGRQPQDDRPRSPEPEAAPDAVASAAVGPRRRLDGGAEPRGSRRHASPISA